MTINELHKLLDPTAKLLEDRANEAEADQFAPWVVGAIRDAAKLLRTLDNGAPL